MNGTIGKKNKQSENEIEIRKAFVFIAKGVNKLHSINYCIDEMNI